MNIQSKSPDVPDEFDAVEFVSSILSSDPEQVDFNSLSDENLSAVCDRLQQLDMDYVHRKNNATTNPSEFERLQTEHTSLRVYDLWKAASDIDHARWKQRADKTIAESQASLDAANHGASESKPDVVTSTSNDALREAEELVANAEKTSGAIQKERGLMRRAIDKATSPFYRTEDMIDHENRRN